MQPMAWWAAPEPMEPGVVAAVEAAGVIRARTRTGPEAVVAEQAAPERPGRDPEDTVEADRLRYS